MKDCCIFIRLNYSDFLLHYSERKPYFDERISIYPGMKRADTYHRAINEFLNPEAVEHERSSHFNRIDAIGAGKRMTQTNPKELEFQLPEEKE